MKMKKLILAVSLGLISSSSYSVASFQAEHDGTYMDSKKNKQLIMFVNGIQNTLPNAQSSAKKLAETLGFDKNDPQYSYTYFYNPKGFHIDKSATAGMLSFADDSLELRLQAKYSEKAFQSAGITDADNMTEKQKQDYYYNLGQEYRDLIDRLDRNNLDATSRNIASTTQRLARNIENKLTNSVVKEPFKTLILVPHSQGNFFVESAYAYLYYQGKNELLKRVRVVGVASVAGTTPSDTYLSSPKDKAVFGGQGNMYHISRTKIYHPLNANTDFCTEVNTSITGTNFETRCYGSASKSDLLRLETVMDVQDVAGHGFDNVYLNPLFKNNQNTTFPNIIKDYILNFNKVLKERYVEKFYQSLEFSTGKLYSKIPTNITLKLAHSDQLDEVSLYNKQEGKTYNFTYDKTTDTWNIFNVTVIKYKGSPTASFILKKRYKNPVGRLYPAIVTKSSVFQIEEPKESIKGINISLPNSTMLNTDYKYSISLDTKDFCINSYSIDWGDKAYNKNSNDCLDVSKLPSYRFTNSGVFNIEVKLVTSDKQYLVKRKRILVKNNFPLPQLKVIPSNPTAGKDFYLQLVGGDLTKVAKVLIRYGKESKVLVKKQISSKITVNSNESSLPVTISYYDKSNKKINETTKVIKLQGGSPTSSKSKLTATGITKCGDYPYDKNGKLIKGHESNNDLNCSLNYDSEGDPIPTGQDGHFQAGEKMLYIKLKRNGAECVKDKRTGLIWEQKTDDGGVRDKDNTYTWYNPDLKNNGGYVGRQNGDSSFCKGSKCNTYAYIRTLNRANYCGYSDWRMPTRSELISIVNYGRFSPAINRIFTNTQNSEYWSASPNASSDKYAWYVDFNHGYAYSYDKYSKNYYGYKNNDYHVRAVRSD